MPKFASPTLGQAEKNFSTSRERSIKSARHVREVGGPCFREAMVDPHQGAFYPIRSSSCSVSRQAAGHCRGRQSDFADRR
jgi:hypothetical protein